MPPRSASPIRSVLLLVSSLSLLPTSAQAQISRMPDRQLGTWTIASVVLPGGPKRWGGYAEVQGRAQGLMQQFFYYELKGGVSYEVAKNFTAMLAGGRYSTSDYQAPEDGPLSVERRLWEQLTLTQFASRLKLEHRYRVEQRWFRFRDGVVPAGQFRYRNRIRYRFNVLLPLNRPTFAERTLFLSVYDEVFFNPRGSFWERNRVYAGLGFEFDKHWTVQSGWLHQANYTPASLNQGVFMPQTIAAKNNVLLSVIYRLGRPKSTSPTPEYVPSQPD